MQTNKRELRPTCVVRPNCFNFSTRILMSQRDMTSRFGSSRAGNIWHSFPYSFCVLFGCEIAQHIKLEHVFLGLVSGEVLIM